LTTNTEKSSDCTVKSGITTVNNCLPYAMKPKTRGVVAMEDDGSSIESMAGKVAAGA